MYFRLDHFDGIDCHSQNIARTIESSETAAEASASGTAARLAQSFGHGVPAASGFARDLAYRRQLGDLIAVAVEARSRAAL